MDININFICESIIEINVETTDGSVVEDICNLDGIVPDEFIENLEEITEQLKAHNIERAKMLNN